MYVVQSLLQIPHESEYFFHNPHKTRFMFENCYCNKTILVAFLHTGCYLSVLRLHHVLAMRLGGIQNSHIQGHKELYIVCFQCSVIILTTTYFEGCYWLVYLHTTKIVPRSTSLKLIVCRSGENKMFSDFRYGMSDKDSGSNLFPVINI